ARRVAGRRADARTVAGEEARSRHHRRPTAWLLRLLRPVRRGVDPAAVRALCCAGPVVELTDRPVAPPQCGGPAPTRRRSMGREKELPFNESRRAGEREGAAR